MPILFPILGAVAAELGVSLGQRYFGAVAGGLLSSVQREAVYTGNRGGETIIPDVPALLRLWWTGRIEERALIDMLQSQAIAWNDRDDINARRPKAWHSLIELDKPLWSPDLYRKWLRLERISLTEYKEMMARHGYGSPGFVLEPGSLNTKNYELWTQDWQPLDLSVVIDLWRRDQVSRGDAMRALLAGGIHEQDAATLLDAWDQPPQLSMLLDMVNRGIVSEQQMHEYLKWTGYRRPEERNAIAKMRFWLPSPPDLVTFAVREAWNEEVVRDLGYDQDRPEAFDFWMNKSGAGGSADFPPLPEGTPPGTTWAQLFWRAHWQNISPSQAYEMYHRLRPSRLARFGAEFRGLRAFTLDNVKAILKINDYPVGLREPLAAINSSLLTRVDIQRAHELEIIDEAEVKEQFLDRGYVEADAQTLTDFTAAQARVHKGSRFIDRSKALIEKAYESGSITRQTAARLLYEASMFDPQEALAWRRRTVADRNAVAAANEYVQWALQIIDTKILTAHVTKATAIIRIMYIHGRFNANEARVRLTNVGLTVAKIEELLKWWEFERFGPRRDLTARKIRTLANEKIINIPEARRRLYNLGYSEADVTVLINEIAQDFFKDLAKSQMAQAKTVAQAQRAQQAMLRAIEAEKKRAQNELARYAGPSQLVDFFARGYLDMATMDRRLKAILEDQDKVNWWEAKAVDERNKRVG